ncbi:TMV resistance protein N [Senna tora]|uniref:TMV resistance protein N n=1 Tax=Senna tora TaxID=362788 RepID=A0A834XAB8_9FABA|nr:TMV resistance protein N [Senna tora]
MDYEQISKIVEMPRKRVKTLPKLYSSRPVIRDNGITTQVINDIVRSAKNILGMKGTSGMDEIGGIQPQLEALEKLVDLDSKDVIRVIGIFGMHGSGITTLASLLYHRISHKFDAFCFLNINGVSYLQEQILREILQEEDLKKLPNLRNLDLHGSKNLMETPHFERLPNLEKLNVEGCIGLVMLDPSITFLTNLKLLNLRNCTSLVSVPNNLFGQTSLEILNVAGCSKFAEFLDFDEETGKQLVACGICREHAECTIEASSSTRTQDKYPTAKCIVGLDEIDGVCDNSYVKALDKFKDPYWREAFLTMSHKGKKAWVSYQESIIYDIVRSANKILSSKFLTKEANYRRLRTRGFVLSANICKWIMMQETDKALRAVDKQLEELENLVDLASHDALRIIGICGMHAPEIRITTLASVLYHRISHKFDAFCFLHNVRTISATSNGTLTYLRNLDLHGCKNLMETPHFERLPRLEKLNVEGCIGLVVLHPSIAFLKNLRFVNLRNCTSLISVPNNLFSLSSLEILNVAGCSKFAEYLYFDDWMSSIEGEEVLGNQDLPLYKEMEKQLQAYGIKRKHTDSHMNVGVRANLDEDRKSKKQATSFQMEDAPKAETSLAMAENTSAVSIEASSSTITADDEYHIAKCVVGLDEIDDVSDNSYMKALEKFKDQYWRQVFLTMSHKRKKTWLNSLV